MAIKLTKDEKVQRQTNVDHSSVQCVRTVKPSADSPIRYVVDWTLDFKSVTETELLELAARSVIIDVQREFRGLTDAERESDEWSVRTVDVRELLDRERLRTPKDPVKAVTKAFESMTEDQKAQILAVINGS